MKKHDFVEFKKILMVALKEYGASHALKGRIVESFRVLDEIYTEKNEWSFEKGQGWWKLWEYFCC